MDDCAVIGNVAVIALDRGVLFWHLMSNRYQIVAESDGFDDVLTLGLSLPVWKLAHELQAAFYEA